MGRSDRASQDRLSEGRGSSRPSGAGVRCQDPPRRWRRRCATVMAKITTTPSEMTSHRIAPVPTAGSSRSGHAVVALLAAHQVRSDGDRHDQKGGQQLHVDSLVEIDPAVEPRR